jgi:HEAT repeat protein
MRRTATVLLPLLACAVAAASDAKAFEEMKARYEKAAKIRDETGIRDRRKLILGLFDYLDQKGCRKLLRDAFDDEDSADTRVAVVQVLGASGDPKDLDYLAKSLGSDREKLRGPVIALGEGLSYTAKPSAAAAAGHAAELAAKAKEGDLRFALLEGVAELGDPAAYDALVAMGDKLVPDTRFMRNVALGSCGKEKAVAGLAGEIKAASPLVRLSAVLGLARTDSPAALQAITEALGDPDPRVVEAAANAVLKAKHAPAAPALAEAMAIVPRRVQFTVRAALAALLGKDVGMDAAAWKAVISGKKPEPPTVAADQPALPKFFGIPVASDRIAIVLALPASMQWLGRLARAQEGICEFLTALPDDASFDVYTCARTTESFSPTLVSGAESRTQAQDWVRKRLYAHGVDLKATISQILDEQPDVDTILLATDHEPWGQGAAETSQEALEVIRRANLTRRVRIHTSFVVPGGRYTKAEINEDEFEARADALKQLAETSGGRFVRLDK